MLLKAVILLGLVFLGQAIVNGNVNEDKKSK